jgi:hypothetical protein
MAAEHDEDYDGELVADEVTLLLTKLQGEGISNRATVYGVYWALQDWMHSFPGDVARGLIQEFVDLMSDRTEEAEELNVPMMIRAATMRLDRKRNEPM